MFKVYILKSKVVRRFYIGHTEDLVERLARHNSGRVRSTKAFKSWTVVYTEEFPNKSETYKREQEIKSYKSGYKFKELMKSESWQSG